MNDRIALSSIKQYRYCPRRYGLMYIECAWGSNYKIIEGDILHEKVDDPFFFEKRGDIHISRSVPIFSDTLGLYGVADIIELIKDSQGARLKGKKDLWRINVLEYKNGKPEKSRADYYQLCAQVMCIEEMFKVSIHTGDIFYGKIRRRVTVEITSEMKEEVKRQIKKMRDILESHIVPKKTKNQNCYLCSLIDICIPTAQNRKENIKDYIQFLMGKR